MAVSKMGYVPAPEFTFTHAPACEDMRQVHAYWKGQ